MFYDEVDRVASDEVEKGALTFNDKSRDEWMIHLQSANSLKYRPLTPDLGRAMHLVEY